VLVSALHIHKKINAYRRGFVSNPSPRQSTAMPEVMDWPQGEARAEVARAVQRLREGRPVVLPTESTYVVTAAILPGAASTLDKVVGADAPLAILLGHAVEVFDWLPFFRGAGIRLARRFWPRPLTLVSGAGLRQGQFSRLPECLQSRLAAKEELSIRLLEHAAGVQIAQRLGAPLIAASTSWTDPDQMTAGLAGQDVLVIQDGHTRFAQRETVVQVHGRAWRTLHEGPIPADAIDEAAPCRIVFVCTGNTCRSPLAEGLCSRLLADKFGCPVSELAKHGFYVQSAGIAAMMGMEAAPEAVAIAAELGADLTDHYSQPLSMEMMLRADRLFVMTASHLRLLREAGGVWPRLLAPSGEDVADPIGGTPEVYRACALQIRSYLEKLLPELWEC
jgi:protein-tyrosine phosphatase